MMLPRLALPLVASLLAAAALARAEPGPAPLPIGASAPDFSLPGVDGRTYTLQDFAKARALVLVFTCNHCPSAQLAEDRIKQLATDYGTQGVAVVAISSSSPRGLRLDELGWTDLDDSFEAMKIRARDRGFNFPYLYDGDEPQSMCMAYGPVATPHVYVFDAARKLRYAGRVDDDERGKDIKKHFVREAIDAVLAGREPEVKQTRPVGCSTKWFTKEPQVKSYLEKLAAEPVELAEADEAALKALKASGSGKVRLVKFWATWCAPCIADFPEYVTINRMYRHRDFEFVTVSLNKPDERSDVLAFLKKQQASNRNLILAAGDREKQLDAFDKDWNGEVPYTVLLSPEGGVLFKESGSVDPLTLKRTILKELNARRAW